MATPAMIRQSCDYYIRR